MSIRISRDNSSVRAALSQMFASRSGSFATIVETSGPGNEISLFLKDMTAALGGAVFLEGETDSPYPFMVPYRPFFYSIYFSKAEFDDFRAIDYNRVEKLAYALGISTAADGHKFSTFELMKSFYGFKHEAKDSPARLRIFQEVACVLSHISSTRGDIVMHIRNAHKMGPETAEMASYVLKAVRPGKIMMVLSYPAGCSLDVDCAANLAGHLFGVHSFAMPSEKASPDLAAEMGRLCDEERSLLSASSVFYNDFRVPDLAAALGAAPERVAATAAALAEKGFLSRSPYPAIFRHPSPEYKEACRYITEAAAAVRYNTAILAAFTGAVLPIPDIGLTRLVYHALSVGDFEVAVRIGNRLAVSLCEIGCPANALKLVKFVENSVFHRQGASVNQDLRLETYLVHGQVHLALGKPARAFEYFTALREKVRPAAHEKAARAALIEIEKWLGFILLLRPELAGEKETAPLRCFTEALALDTSSTRNRIECNNLIALYNYQSGELEKASIFYRDNLKIFSMHKDDPSLSLESDSTMRGLSSVCLRQGEFRKSFAYLKKCEDVCVRSANRKMLANTFHYMGMIHHSRGEFAEAMSHYDRSMAVLSDISDSIGQSRVWTSMGVTLFNLGRYRDALDRFDKSLEVAVLTNNRRAIAILSGNSARIYALLGDLSSAFAALAEDIAILGQTKDRFGMAYALAFHGDVCHMAGKTDDALESYRRSLEIAAKSQFLIPQVLSSLGIVCSLAPDRVADDAKPIVEGLLAIDVRDIDMVSRSLILRARGIHESACGIHHRATCFINQALVNFEKLRMPLETAQCLIDEGKLFDVLGQRDAGAERRDAALRIFREIGAEYYVSKYGAGDRSRQARPPGRKDRP